MKDVHLDKYLEQILNSKVNEEMQRYLPQSRIYLILKLACIFASPEAMTRAVQLLYYIDNSSGLRLTCEHILEVYKPILNLL